MLTPCPSRPPVPDDVPPTVPARINQSAAPWKGVPIQLVAGWVIFWQASLFFASS